MTDPRTPEEQIKTWRHRAEREHQRVAAANRENAALRQQIRELRQANFMLQRYIDSPSSQAGYKRRYEQLLASVHMAKDILVTELNGLPVEEPKTMEDWKPPKWARKV